MTKYFKKDFICSNWNNIRDILFLLLLFSYIMLRLYNMSWVVLGDMIPGFDVFTVWLESYGFPIIMVLFYIVNLLIDKNYFEIKAETIKITLFILFAIVSAEHITCLALGAFILCADFSSIKKISAVSAAGIMLATLCVIWASQTGWTGDHIVSRFDRNAHFFGFFHYAIWARQVLFATILYLISKTKRISLPELAVFAIIQWIVFYYSTQRLTFVVSILTVIIFFIINKYEIIKINNKFIAGLSASVFPAAMAGTIWVSLIYTESNAILVKLNNMLSTRFYLQKLTFEVFNIKLFAQQVHHVTDFYLYIDNGYLYALFAFGIILTAAIITVFSYMFWRSCKTNNTGLFSLLLIASVYLLVDNPICDMTCIGIALLFFPILFKEHMAEKRFK